MLLPPPAPTVLVGLPRFSLRGRTLHRVFRAGRSDPWWFASLPSGAVDADEHGRFDLPTPLGSCYLALTAVGAVLEAFQEFTGRLPDTELRRRLLAVVVAPDDTPVAANVKAPASRRLGVTAALWAGADRGLTQSWALAIHRAGWRAMHHGIAHDPAGAERAVTLFDTAGEHAPYDDTGWTVETRTLHDDEKLHSALRRFGVSVARSDVDLPVVRLEDSGLM
jgi:hypothetical protein